MNRFQSELLHCSESFIYALNTLVEDALSMVPAWYFVYLNTHLHGNSPQKSDSWSILEPEKWNRWNPTRPCEEMYSLYSRCCRLLHVEFLPVSIWAISTTGRRPRPDVFSTGHPRGPRLGLWVFLGGSVVPEACDSVNFSMLNLGMWWIMLPFCNLILEVSIVSISLIMNTMVKPIVWDYRFLLSCTSHRVLNAVKRTVLEWWVA